MRALLLALGFALGLAPAVWGETLQQQIDAAEDGAEILLPPGNHAGPLVITHPVVIDGGGVAVIDGGGKGTIVTIAADGVTLKNLILRNSGRLHNKVDAGLRIKGNFNVIRDVRIENSLFGMDLTQANNNVMRRNYISSKEMPLEMRGDSVRIWYSNDNIFEQNTIEHARDFVVWYSSGNKIQDNFIRHGRYGIHFMYAHHNWVERNEISDCVVGVFLMYANEITVSGNKILRSWGAAGMGVGFKETSGAKIFGNEIIGNAVGIYIDPSPWDPDLTNDFEDNMIAYNGIGVQFHTDWERNNFRRNSFLSNFTQVSVRGRGGATRNGWLGNYWDDYAGFDRDGDGIGDAPYEVYTYADQLWQELPPASFFRGGLALAALDFVERLAPFSEPKLILREAYPLSRAPALHAPEAALSGSADKPKTALEMLQ